MEWDSLNGLFGSKESAGLVDSLEVITQQRECEELPAKDSRVEHEGSYECGSGRSLRLRLSRTRPGDC